MNYKETVEFLFSQLPMFQRTGPAAYKANLDNSRLLDDFNGNPHREFRSVHIAGTNGKGSVSHMLAAVLQSAGYKTGLFTSPHMTDFRERIRINGEMINEEYICRFVEENTEIIKEISPSFFELTTIMAFRYFADSGVDIAVIETGMGGRLDSSNIIIPVISVITNIGLDHTQFLGDTLELIAAEKAGIIKEGVPVVISEWQKETESVFISFAGKMHSKLYFASRKYAVQSSFLNPSRKQVMYVRSGDELAYSNLCLDLAGLYQRKNLPGVLQTIDCLNETGFEVPEKAIYEGLKQVSGLTGLRGRWEEIGFNPLTICDSAHNAEGIADVMAQVRSTAYKKLHIVMGLVSDKDSSRILSLLPKEAVYYFTRADIPRALDPEILEQRARAFGLNGKVFQGVSEAYNFARKNAAREDMIFIGGSSFVVADLLGAHQK